MDTTRASLLLRIRDERDAQAWRIFDQIYRPLLFRYVCACGASSHDADDVVQQCMVAVRQHIGSFEYDPEKGRFKGWLRTMAVNNVRKMLRDRRDRMADSATLNNMESAESPPDETFEQLWLQQHLWHCLRELEGEVEPATYRAFHDYVIAQHPVEKVAADHGMTANHVYTIKWRLTDKVAAKMKALLDGES